MYDQETGLYYLQSRYYDPEVGRFINADGFTTTGQGILGNNMFAYCLNNPITYADTSGTIPFENNRFRSHATLNGGGSFCDGGISGVVRKEHPDWLKRLNPANDDERVVLEAEHFAFYKGVPVLKANFGEGGGFSFGIIVLDDSYKYDEKGVNTLKHEYGHRLHMEDVGVFTYAVTTAIPSLIGAGLSYARIIDVDYYSLPWEYVANMYSNVNHTGYTGWANKAGAFFWLFTKITSALIGGVL